MASFTVSLFSPAFSFIIYENMKSEYVQEGFLLGNIVERETLSITDNDQRQVSISKEIKINSVLPWPELFYFYNGAGRVDKNKVKEFLGDKVSEVVAWYKYKKVQSFEISLRERLIHRQLSELFSVPYEQFLFCSLTSKSLKNNSMHTYQQQFFGFNNMKNNFEQLPLRITNLSDLNDRYKKSKSPSDTFNKIVDSLPVDFKKSQGVTFITTLQAAIQKYTIKEVEELASAELKLFELEKEVMALKNSLDVNLDSTSDNCDNEAINGDLEDYVDSSPTENGRVTRSNKSSPISKKNSEDALNQTTIATRKRRCK